jgi:glutathione synthase/RimK-type ligase-like ATP-grasp enzyme
MEVMVQPYLQEITTQGEWSLIFFGGAFSHAVIKRPARGDFRVQAEHGGTVVRAAPPDHVLHAATAAIAALPIKPLYARIDGVERSGKLLLMEAECVDPYLYFELDAAAPHAFAVSLEEAIKPPRKVTAVAPRNLRPNPPT